MSAPQVSVVIPTHDRRDMFGMTLRTALWQQDVDLEVIVVDDGSADGTGEFVSRLGDDRIHLLRHDTPQGVSAARNRGIEAAQGDWIAFLDDDDLWAPNKLEAQLGAAERAATWSYTGAVKIDDRQRIRGGTPPPPPSLVMSQLPSFNLVPGGCSGVIATREALTEAGRFDPRLVNLADWDLWIRLGRTGAPASIPDPLVGYRMHPAQSSLDVDLILNEAAIMDGRYGARIDQGALHHYLAHRCVYAGWRRRALRHFARAALLGEVVPVTMHLWSMARHHAAARLSWRPPRDRHAAWRMQAQEWLQRLEDPVEAPDPRG
jgi:glycosyltransferase involved in cell wall biosynthesis